MTAKDKNLLTIAVALLILLALIMFGIKPAADGFKEENARKSELKTKKVEMQTQIEALPRYEQEYKDAAKDYRKVASRVYGDLKSADIQDATINDLAAACGVTPTEFSIVSVAGTELTPYSVIVDERGQKVGSGLVTYGTGSVRTAELALSVFGTPEQIVSLVDLMSSKEGISIQQFNYAQGEGGTTGIITFIMVLSETY